MSRLPSPLRLGNRLLLESRRPSTASTIKRPFLVAAGIAHPNRGSALRISHPFSGFRETEFHGLISCRNRSWTVSLLSVPPAKVGGTFQHPIACFPAVIHQRAKTRHSRPYHPRFQPTTTFERSSLTSPEDYELPLSQARRPASRSPWTTSGGSPPTASFTSSEALIPSQIRSRPARVAPN